MKSIRVLLIISISVCWLVSASFVQPAGHNLLRNCTFQRQTNSGLPDYWDLHHAAALTLENLHAQFGIDETVVSPVSGAKVLKVINSEDSFGNLALMPTRFYAPLPPGEYTFSVYLRADNNRAKSVVVKSWGSSQSNSYRLSTDWKRYSSTFRTTGTDVELAPMLYFKTKGSYYVAAPQLEKGSFASSFQPDMKGALPEVIAAGNVSPDKSKLKELLQNKFQNTRPVEAVFEFDYYTDDSTARLFITSGYKTALSLGVSCQNPHAVQPVIASNTLKPLHETSIDIPLGNIPVGEFACTIKASSGHSLVSTVTAKLHKRELSPLEVRVNRKRRFITINKQPFQIIGIMTGPQAPDWYLKNLVDHGFNTVFCTAPTKAGGRYDLACVRRFLDAASRHQLKVIVGLPLAGSKPADWRLRLEAFCRMVEAFKSHPAVLGWWPYDEPAPTLWKDSELLEAYTRVKDLDPYHLVFGNWDAIPSVDGSEPIGTLASTDIYSHDYYPFAWLKRSIYGFGNTNLHVSRTAFMKNKPSHVFIQLYGNGDAWREPTGDELNFMTVLALINGSMTSYYDTKSACRETWARMTEINSNTRALSTTLFLDPSARKVKGPGIQGNFLYSLWEKGNQFYAVVLHINNTTERLAMNVSGFVDDQQSEINMLFGNGPGWLVKGSIMDSFLPYEAKVYILNRNSSS